MLRVIVLCLGAICLLECIMGLYIEEIAQKYDLPVDFFASIGTYQSFRSNLTVYEHRSVPDNTMWSICHDCSFGKQGIQLWSRESELRKKVTTMTLSGSNWQEFFYLRRNDKFMLSSTSSAQAKFIVERPVFIVPIITLHPGHLLIDVFESIFHAMMTTYGRVRTDALIVLDVAAEEEREVLERKLAYAIKAYSDPLYSLYSLFLAFSTLPVLTSANFLTDLASIDGIVLRSLHLGADTSKSFYYQGFRNHPQSAVVSAFASNNLAYQRRLAAPHRAFQSYLYDYLTPLLKARGEPVEQSVAIDVLLVQRTDNRVIMNLDAVVRALQLRNLTVAIVALEDLTLWRQLQLLRNAKILLGAGGTTFHNLVFMSRSPLTYLAPNPYNDNYNDGKHLLETEKKSVVAIILMQSADWCSWSWLYYHQALLLGHSALVLCPPSPASALSSSVIAGVRKSSQQPPVHSKMRNISVDIEGQLEPALDTALRLLRRQLHPLESHPFQTQNHREPTSNASATRNEERSSLTLEIYHGRERSVLLPADPLAEDPVTKRTEEEEEDEDEDDELSLISVEVEELKIAVYDIESKFSEDADGVSRYHLRVTLDLVMGHRGILNSSATATIASLWPALSICFQVYTPDMSDSGSPSSSPASKDRRAMIAAAATPWCVPFDRINYYGVINLALPALPRPVAVLHLSLRTSPHGGALRGSEAWYAFDARVQGTKALHSFAAEETIEENDTETEDSSKEMQGRLQRKRLLSKVFITGSFALQTAVAMDSRSPLMLLQSSQRSRQLQHWLASVCHSMHRHQPRRPADDEDAYLRNCAAMTLEVQIRLHRDYWLPRVLPRQVRYEHQMQYMSEQQQRQTNQGLSDDASTRLTAYSIDEQAVLDAAFVYETVLNDFFLVSQARHNPTNRNENGTADSCNSADIEAETNTSNTNCDCVIPLPLPLLMPSPVRPFIFLHVEKSGGTSLREILHHAAQYLFPATYPIVNRSIDSIEKQNQSEDRSPADHVDTHGLQQPLAAAYIPCYGQLSCFLFRLPRHVSSPEPATVRFPQLLSTPLSSPSTPSAAGVRHYLSADLSAVRIVAGHFAWGVWRSLPGYVPPPPTAPSHRPRRDVLDDIIEYIQVLTNHVPAARTNATAVDDDVQRESRFESASESSRGHGLASAPVSASPSGLQGYVRDTVSATTSSTQSRRGTAHQALFQPSCFLLFRHPATRVISQYYERIYHERAHAFYRRRIDSLDLESFQGLLESYRWGRWMEDNRTAIVVDDGFGDITCRALLDNKKTTAGFVLQGDHPHRDTEESDAEQRVLQIPPRITEKETSMAVRRMQRCVVGLLENWSDTLRVLDHWFPWILAHNTTDTSAAEEETTSLRDVRAHRTKDRHETAQTIPASHLRAINAHNRCDLTVYTAARQRFREQLALIEQVRRVY